MKNDLRFIIISTFLIILSSCDNNFLERFPLDSPSDATFFSTESELELATNAVYSNFYYNAQSVMPFQLELDLASDIGWDRDLLSIQTLGKGQATPTLAVFSTAWFAFYKAIAECNQILANMSRAKENTQEDVYNRIEGEARFFRAYYYSLLTSLYGNVPFFENPVEYKDAAIAATSKTQIVEFIISELEKSSQLLPDSYSGNKIGKITKGGALAIKARVALFEGKWAIAADASNRVINSNLYKLYSDYGELFTYAGESSSEAIIEIQFARGYKTHNIPKLQKSRLGGGWTTKIPTQSMVDSYYCIDGLPIDKSPLYDASHPFINRDPRLQATIAVPGSIFCGYQFETHPDSVKCWDYNVNPPVRKTNSDATNAYATFSGYCYRKYTDEVLANNMDSELNVMLVRYAEVLLIYAEAKIEMNEIDNSVYHAINLVRERVNMPVVEVGKSQAELKYLIRNERKVELAFEGLRYFDIRRWKIAEDVMSGSLYGRPKRDYLSSYIPTFDENGTPHYDAYADKLRKFDTRYFNASRDYLWAIPQKELDINPNLVQNAGY